MPKKVLLISQYFLPDISAVCFRMNDLYQALKQKGYDVTVITTYPQKASVEQVEETKDIHRLELVKVQKKSFMTYLRNYFGFMFKVMFHSLFHLRKKKFDYVIVTSPPLFVALGGLITSWFKRAKLIVDIRDIWPDSAVSAGMLKKEGMLHRMSRRLETFVYKRADYITCVSEPMKEEIYTKSRHHNIHVLYNGVSEDNMEQAMIPGSTGPTAMTDKIIVGYAGNIGMVQNMHRLLEAAHTLSLQGYADVFHFQIIGDGIDRKALEEEAQEKQLTNMTFTGALTQEDTYHQMAQTDILFFSLIEDPVFETTIPSKLFDYLLSNKPIITSIKGEGRKILQEIGCALFFDATESGNLVHVLLEYKGNKSKYDTLAKQNREYVTRHYNRTKMFRTFLEQL